MCVRCLQEEDKVVHVVEAGNGFGELALLYNKPRAATVKVNRSAGPATYMQPEPAASVPCDMIYEYAGRSML